MASGSSLFKVVHLSGADIKQKSYSFHKHRVKTDNAYNSCTRRLTFLTMKDHPQDRPLPSQGLSLKEKPSKEDTQAQVLEVGIKEVFKRVRVVFQPIYGPVCLSLKVTKTWL